MAPNNLNFCRVIKTSSKVNRLARSLTKMNSPLQSSAQGRATRICRHLTPAATDSAVRNKYPSRTGSVQIPIELHGYQRDFLDNVAASSLTPPLPPYLHPFLSSSRHEALQSLIELAMADEDVRSEIFGDFHCVHCGGVNPADWINKHKGDKQAYPFELSNEVAGASRISCCCALLLLLVYTFSFSTPGADVLFARACLLTHLLI